MAPADPDVLDLLRDGDIVVEGRLVEASNATLYCAISAGERTGYCVYKPVRGERPLWDFPDGTLAGREVASYLVSESTGWGLIPPTILRPGPFGPGMVQQWIDVIDDVSHVDVVAPELVPDGWRRVLRATDVHGDPVLLVHADDERLRHLAVLDALLNNADRKGGHVLAGPGERVYGVDHGICLHHEPKLRTVLWGFLGEPLSTTTLDVLRRVRVDLDGDLGEALDEHLTRREVRALRYRADALLDTETYPQPGGDYPSIPWPAF